MKQKTVQEKREAKDRRAEALTKVAPMPRRRGRSARGTVALAALVLLAFAAMRPACTLSLNDPIAKLAASIGEHTAAPEIAIVAIDDRSIRELGSWPWPRATFVDLLEALRRMNAGLIVVDARTASDMALADLRLPVRRNGGADYVVGYDFYPTLAEMPAETKTEKEDAELKDAADKLAFPSTPTDDAPIPAMAGIRMNRFAAADRPWLREGFGNIFPDADGAVRTQPLAARLRHRVYPALSLVAAAQWRGFTPILAQDAEGSPAGAILGEERIATGADARLLINFRGKAGFFERITAADIAAGKIKPESVDSRLVLVGLTAPMLDAAHATPLGEMPDIEILAYAIDNLIMNRGLTSLAGRGWTLLFLAAVALAYVLMVPRLAPKLQLGATTLLIAGFLAAGIVSLAHWRVELPAMPMAIVAAILCAASLGWRLVRHEAPRRLIRKAWRGRISDAEIELFASDPSLAEGAARAVSVTAFAVDIKGFGSIVEFLSPTQLAEFIKAYRSVVAEAVLEQGGFIEAFAGDECLAVFGAPAKNPAHALAALRAAAKLRRSVAGRRDELDRRYGVEKLRIGIGIQTGIAAAGDTGAGGVGYGMVGAAIEAAAQLRALNRLYRTSTLVGDAARVATEGSFAYRALDPVVLRGEGSAAFIHEFVGEAGTILPQLADFLEAREAYLRGDFRRATQLFGEVLQDHPHDGPSQLFFKRATYLAENPPQEKWFGLWR